MEGGSNDLVVLVVYAAIEAVELKLSSLIWEVAK
jgi:hypothetical protein